MAAKRGKKQARRKEESSVPGYVWLLAGLLIGAAVAVTLYVKMPHSINDLMPHPNPAAQPTTAKDPGAAPEGNPAASPATAATPAAPKKPRYTFYALLPEKEVIIPDEELSAQVKAEAAANLASKQQAAPAIVPGIPANPPTSPTTSVTGLTQTTAASTKSVPNAPTAAAIATAKAPTPPIASTNPTSASVSSSSTASPMTAPPTTSTADTTSIAPKSGQYLLQAGAFRNDKQADDLKARIAMLGLVGRVEVVQTPNGEMHRVRLGPYATASELEQAKQKLSSGGVTGSVAVRLK